MPTPLTVLTWLWSQPSGRSQFTAAHVNIWADGIRQHLTLPHRIACVTDMPEGIDPSVEIIPPTRDFENVRIPTWPEERPQCLRRLALFRRDAAEIFGERFVSMDLDCVIAGSLDPLFDIPDDFRMYRGTAKRRLYNGSMLLMTAGARPHVYDDFTPEAAAVAGRQCAGSDQAWISHALGPGEPTWGAEHGVFWWGSPDYKTAPSRRLVFCLGQPKPWDIVGRNSDLWVVEHYRRSPRSGRCLILGYGDSVWDDLNAAYARYGAFDAVIASPEAAEYWRGPILEIAATNEAADRLAAMHGFAETVWCGRHEAGLEMAVA